MTDKPVVEQADPDDMADKAEMFHKGFEAGRNASHDLITLLEARLASQERALGVAKEALEDAERVCEWGEPQPKPVLARVREALTQIEGEGER